MNLYEGTLTLETGAVRVLVWASSSKDATDKVGELLNPDMLIRLTFDAGRPAVVG